MNPDENRNNLNSVILRAITILVVLIAFAAGFVITWEIVLTLFLAVLFAVFLNHASLKVSQWLPLSRKGSLAAVVVALLSIFIGVNAFFFTQINQQIEQADQEIDQGAQKVQEWTEQYPSVKSAIQSTPFLAQIIQPSHADPSKQHSDSSAQSDKQTSEKNQAEKTASDKSSATSKPNLNSLPQPAKKAASLVGQMFKTTFGLIVNSLLIFFVGLFLAVSPQSYRDGTVLLVPPARRERIRDLMNQLSETLWQWLVGRFASMLVTGLGASVLLFLIGVPMAGTLGVMTGLLTFIPNIGSLIAFLLAILVALSNSPTTAALVVPTYAVLQLVESYLVTPLIQQKQVSLPPALLISFQAIMGVLFGFLGAAVASPLLAASKVVVEELYVNDYLEGQKSSSQQRLDNTEQAA
ncbi:pheromone autoinducer 2 transporter [Gimesia alba]|uniref:Pheromone autoinducer 2 transporter n=1 Tax=Gimesia alba TaxID=2527973 RepID=A0A517R824_9PLAN|nr:AI-2E family transporter [Gimesia alba]QDT40036.1 pheromone autoinducer 2 transporter [Gimesia alba]